MTLTEFLLARIAEDEGRVDGISQAAELDYVIPEDWQFYIDRMASECEAKRRIMEHCADDLTNKHRDVYVLEFLALPYADHPDYDKAWRP